ncbi:lasso peptide biosynthesis PqqD family chaperone [Metabacillus sp. KIGAM252]|uniref:Lasso peptide biosynthesis PqqD family chaperone n=1 Tax=Metabacillus flavus TaxID=2823519 RepID=A0ABS5LFZ0_9BACI|nr:lasso peptide biosynthesis PqqD family chaperone [Metabacillus flavus]MBS2969641.1 lasso peptide biosynthesis PqqD family chaperone [Metabacillus flavus]
MIRTPLSIEHTVVQKQGNLVSDMNGEKVMLNIENGNYYNLGEIGGAIWERIQNPVSIKELVHQLVSEYDVNEMECEEQVISFLEHMGKENLISIDQ